MKVWLVTFSAKMDEAVCLAILHEAGASQVAGSTVIPLDDEISVEVEASDDVAATLRKHEKVLGVFPSSEMTYY